MNKLQTEAIDRNTECAPMAPEFRALPDLGGAAVRDNKCDQATIDAGINWQGAAVRGEAVAKSESVERTKALEEFYKASICLEGVCGHPDATFDDERRAEERFIAAGKAMRELPISARAADAPSEPSELAQRLRDHATFFNEGCKTYVDIMAAADALDSQPTDGGVRK